MHYRLADKGIQMICRIFIGFPALALCLTLCTAAGYCDTVEGVDEEEGWYSLHGGTVGYWQGAEIGRLGDAEYDWEDGPGFNADLEATLRPPAIGGELFMRVHAGRGDGADRRLEEDGALFADLNGNNDDNQVNPPLRLLEFIYSHRFLEDRVLVTIGKTEPLIFLDDNRFANDSATQFVGKPFINNPILDSEDEYSPLFALGVEPAEHVALTAFIQSTSRPRLEDEDAKKDPYTRPFNQPMVGSQLTFSPEIGGQEGNYRLYGWVQNYEHSVLAEGSDRAGYGTGVSIDQNITETLGVFARAGYSRREVYEVPWFWSVGADLQNLIPGRPEDHFGIGFAGLVGSEELEEDATEYHFETYYRVALRENIGLAPDLQVVTNGGGSTNSNTIVAGGLRLDLSF